MKRAGEWAVGLATLSISIGVVQGVNAAPIVFTGCLAGPTASIGACPGALTTNDSDWSDAILSWTVSGDSNGGPWSYAYTFSFVDTVKGRAPGNAGVVSHAIIELSPSFTVRDLISTSENCESEIGTFTSAQGNSNPGLPGPVYGLKCDMRTEANPINWTITTWRAPVWGDFYAKTGGNENNLGTAINAGYLADDPLAPASDGSVENHILRPDTITELPEPGTLSLLLAAAAAGAVLRRRRG